MTSGEPGPAEPDGPIAEYVRMQAQTVVALGDELILGSSDGTDKTVGTDATVETVHDVRVAVRRLRSTLRTFSAAFDEVAATALGNEARWYAEVLGVVRDLDVVGARLRNELDRLPDGPDRPLLVGDVRSWSDETLAADRGRAWSDLQRVLAGERYGRLRSDLVRWSEAPDWSERSSEVRLRHQVKKAGKRVRRRLRHAVESYGDPAEDRTEVVHRFHHARKAAKRYRYAIELAGPVLNHPEADLAAVRELQDRLGVIQDTVVYQQALLELGTRIGRRPGRNGFTLGVLAGRAAAAQQAAVDDLVASL